MPIMLRQPVRRLSQAEFGELAYSVMGCVFQIHQDLGRFFDEKIYKRELAHRHPGVQLRSSHRGHARHIQETSIHRRAGGWRWAFQEALTHLLGGEARVLADVEVRTSDHKLGHQKMRLAAPRVAFCLTTLPDADPDYESHARRLLRHTELDVILWANISLGSVTFTTIT